MSLLEQSKEALDKIIKKSRVHLYKPIQIAEILYKARVDGGINLKDLETYRNVSKKWRDQITSQLVGRVSTSSAKFQDNLFEDNALPPKFVAALGDCNQKEKGIVENYIYHALKTRLLMVAGARQYIQTHNRKTFSLRDFLALFESQPGLKRSIDKAYEITIFALFESIVRYLNAKVKVVLENPDKEILKDFEDFTKKVLGVDSKTPTFSMTAQLYRIGVTNAADRGLDMLTNFGPVVQVKHLNLTYELAEDILESHSIDKILIVCMDADQEIVTKILSQMGWKERIQGIITLSDLEKWYAIALSEKYKDKIGKSLLSDLDWEFANEFPSTDKIDDFLSTRGYEINQLKGIWATSV